MILKITDGEVTHFLEGFGEARVTRVAGFNEEMDFPDSEGVEALRLYLPHEPSEDEPTERDVVILQPTMGPNSLRPRTIITDFAVYLLNDQGKTVEVINHLS